MKTHAVVIAGGGPTGLVLASELALAGIDVVVVERRESAELVGSRAGGLHGRTIEVLDQRGVADRFLSEGQAVQVARFDGTLLDISDFPTRHNYGLALWQNHFERILAGWVSELPVVIHRGVEVTGFAQDEYGVEVSLSNGESLRAEYLVGCDGGRSLIRKGAGIDFPGWDPTTSWLIAEAEFAEEPAWGVRNDALGTHGISKFQGNLARILVTEKEVGDKEEPTLSTLSEALVTVYGTDYGVHRPVWLSRFTDMTRQAASYREKRVLLAGDAAHVHPPVGGQGLNIGVQDAVNLGWKLAQVIKRISPDRLLDTYHAERHPVAALVLKTTMAQMALRRTDDRTKALASLIGDLLKLDAARRHFAGMMSGLDVHYDLGEGHALLGRRMPDLDLVTPGDPLRVFTLLRDARPVLLDLGAGLDAGRWEHRVRVVRAVFEGRLELPVLGVVPTPAAVLIRPDGYVAWVSDGTERGLDDAVATWF